MNSFSVRQRADFGFVMLWQTTPPKLVGQYGKIKLNGLKCS